MAPCLFSAEGTTDLSGVYPRYVPIASERGTPSPPNNYTDPDLRSWQQNAALIAGVAAAVALLALLLVCCCLFFLFSRQRAAQRIQGYTYYPVRMQMPNHILLLIMSCQIVEISSKTMQLNEFVLYMPRLTLIVVFFCVHLQPSQFPI